MDSAVFQYISSEILPWIITTAASAIAGYFLAALKSMKAKDEAISQGLRVLLSSKIVDAYDSYVNQEKHLTVERKREIDSAYAAYHALGGNGTITALYEELRESSIWIERR